MPKHHPTEALTPEIHNCLLVEADTEYEVDLPVGTKYIQIQGRNEAAIRFAFESGKVAGSTEPYKTLKINEYYAVPDKMSWSG